MTMEHVKITPNQNSMGREPSLTKNPQQYKTPVKSNEIKHRHAAYQRNNNEFAVLPTHITPPSGLTKFIARNPFDADLTNRLHLSVISPTVFSKVPTKLARDSPSFSWSVEELALIQPAKIEEFPMQFCTDPDVELIAQAAIDKFFDEKQIIPSPWSVKSSETAKKSVMLTPSRPLEDLNMTRELHKSKKECWTQTVLTLPPKLPKEVEEVLKPYFTFNQDQNVESEDANLSNNSLRRKLFFNHDDGTEDEEETSLLSSSPKSNGSMLLTSSPPQSGMLVHGTPLKRASLGIQRTHGTPYAGNISPPNMSPICNADSNISCQSIRSRYKSAVRLDFTTDMSVDVSLRDEKELKQNKHGELDSVTSSPRSIVTKERQNKQSENRDLPRSIDENPDQDETTEMMSHEITPLKSEGRQKTNIPPTNSNEILDRLQLAADWCKTHSNESYQQQNATLLGHSSSGHQSAFNSAQDTGYQTYSMSNITSNTDNYNITPIKQHLHWDERIQSNGDEIQLSDWQDNIKSMFSSTPSKYSRRRDN